VMIAGAAAEVARTAASLRRVIFMGSLY
jgi:hypothetical protein